MMIPIQLASMIGSHAIRVKTGGARTVSGTALTYPGAARQSDRSRPRPSPPHAYRSIIPAGASTSRSNSLRSTKSWSPHWLSDSAAHTAP